MTGESDPVHKDARHPFLLSGCKVSDGFGQFLVTAVGMRTEWGKVMATLNEGEEQETPLQVRLKVIATVLGKLGLTVAGLVFAALMIRWVVS
jgi:Ca2+-transporting ATPase